MIDEDDGEEDPDELMEGHVGSSLAGRVNSSSQAVCARMARNARSLVACLRSILMHRDDVLDVAVFLRFCSTCSSSRGGSDPSPLPTWWFSSLVQ